MPVPVEKVEGGLMFPSSTVGRVKGVREYVNNLRSLPWICWQPGWDTLVAVFTIFYMIISYYLMSHSYPLAVFHFIFVNIFVNVLLPAYYVLKVRGEPLDQLGLTRRRWTQSFLLSIILASISLPRMLKLLQTVPQQQGLSTVVFNGITLWEPFFVYSWLQLRFERAFGVLPGIVLAGVCFGSYHLGTYPIMMVLKFFLIGMMYGAVFRLTRSILVVWPLTQTVGSTIGTISGGYTFGWEVVWIYTSVLLLQGLGIWWIYRSQQNIKSHKRDELNVSEKSTARSMSWKDWLLSCIYGGFIVVQIVITLFNYNHLGLDFIANAGWLVLTVSGVFGWMPIYTLRKKGGVPEGKSYIHTRVLVDSGIYAVIRHPQFLAGILMSLAFVLISQHWLNAFLFVPVVAGFYIDSVRADKGLIEKFGDDYIRYMKGVSGLNPLVGIIKMIVEQEDRRSLN